MMKRQIASPKKNDARTAGKTERRWFRVLIGCPVRACVLNGSGFMVF